MGRVLAVVLVSTMLVIAGCSQPAAPEQPERGDAEGGVEQTPEGEKLTKEVSVPADVPSYTLTKDQNGMVQGYDVRDVAATTDVTSEDDLEAITRELWAETNADVLVVTFYPNEPTAESSGVGQAFLGEDAARAFISAQYTDPSVADIDGQVSKAMNNDGLLVISMQDEVEAIEEEMCAEWDVTVMGTPPPEFNCPGY